MDRMTMPAAIRVLLVYPDYVVRRSSSNPRRLRVEPGGWYADGLASISAALKAAGHQPSLLHLTRPIDRESFCAELRRIDPQVIGLTARTSALAMCREYTAWARAALPDATLVWGGYHPTLSPQSCIAVPGVDAVCVGEGEAAMAELADAVSRGSDPRRIGSLWYRTADGGGDDDTVARNPVRPLGCDLDAYPLPDYRLFDRNRLIATRTGTALAMLSRGCPYRCTYCTNHAFRATYPDDRHYHRSRSPRRSIECLRQLREWYPAVREIRFLDNVFGITPEWLEEFGELYRREIGLPFSCDLRVEGVHERALRRLADMGCTHVFIGVESGNEEMRRRLLGRGMGDDEIVAAFRMCHDHGIQALSFNMVGLPGETPADALSTVKLNARARADSSIVSVFSPYPATVLHDVALEKGYIGSGEIDFRDATFLDQPQLPREHVVFMASYFNLLQAIYRRFGERSAVGRMTDRVVLSRRLPRRALNWAAEQSLVARDGLKAALRHRLPGVFRVLRRAVRGR
jgi:radical SAM superfamily enzyme YgiQ (UPF0313 family)